MPKKKNPAYWINKSAEHGEKGEFQQAIDSATEAIRLAPNYAAAYTNRGNAKSTLGRKEEAIKDYDEAIRLDPKLAAAYSNRGASKSDLGRKEEAIKDYDEAIRLDPNSPHAYYNRGSAKALSGKVEDALTDFNTFLRLARQEKNLAKYLVKAEQEILRLEDAIRAGKKEEPSISRMSPIPSAATTERKRHPEAIMFLDMVNSTGIMSKHGVEHHLNLYLELIEKSEAIFAKHSCTYIKGAGDGFMAVAPSATEAVSAMVELMKWIDGRNKTEIEMNRYSVRIGIDYGQATQYKSDRFGEYVVTSSRLENLKLEDKLTLKINESEFPPKDRIFITETVKEEVLLKFPSCVEIGDFKLRGLRNKYTVYNVDWKNRPSP